MTIHVLGKVTNKAALVTGAASAHKFARERGALNAPLPGSASGRLLSKESGKTTASAEAWLWCAMMRLLIRRITV